MAQENYESVNKTPMKAKSAGASTKQCSST
jgi:hypothetical protein